MPKEIWLDRINNEIKSLEILDVLEKDSVIKQDNSVEVIINIEAFGFILGNFKDGIDLKPQRKHRVFLKLNRPRKYAFRVN